MTDGTGTTSYAYHAIGTPPQLGAGLLTSVDGPLSSDTITLTYDELARTRTRAINGVALTRAYDALARLESDTTPLGIFSYAYEGSTERVGTLTYPNGQASTFNYHPNNGDRRLHEIHHQAPGGATLSRFTYTYDAAGGVRAWTQQADAGPSRALDLDYDAADQLRSATLRTTDPTPTVLKRYFYDYDPAANRTSEQINDAVMSFSHDAVNRLVSQQPGGALHFKGTVNEPAAVTVQGDPATVTSDNRFESPAQVSSGTTTVAVTATDPSGNVRTNTYEVTASGASKAYTHDANGNLQGDGVRTFEWDAQNRLIAVNQGTQRTEFTYDGRGRRVRVVEKTSGSVTSDRRFLWCDLEICEERDSSGAIVVRRFYDYGLIENGANLFFTVDHLGSIRELVDAGGIVKARNEYDPYGRATKVILDRDPVLGFTRHFAHDASGLLLAPYRAYDPALARWLSPDPLGQPEHELLKTPFEEPGEADLAEPGVLDLGSVSSSPDSSLMVLDDDGNGYAYLRNSPVGDIDVTGEAGMAGAAGAAIIACLRSPACRKAVTGPAKKCWNFVKNIRCKPPERHPAHHTFFWGKSHCHIQQNCWIKGRKGSKFVIRIPIPCKFGPKGK